jgi:hypothetical protein
VKAANPHRMLYQIMHHRLESREVP